MKHYIKILKIKFVRNKTFTIYNIVYASYEHLLITYLWHTDSSWFSRSTNWSLALTLPGSQGHQSPGSQNWKTFLSTFPHHSLCPSQALELRLEGNPNFDAVASIYNNLLGSSADPRKLQYSVNQSWIHKAIFIFGYIAVDNVLAPITISIKLKYHVWIILEG